MAEEGSISTASGGHKPVHRFLRGHPKSVGAALLLMGVCMLGFGIQMSVNTSVETSTETYSPFWLGALFFSCGVLFILAERNPSKKTITASLALSIISTIGVISAFIDFTKSISSFDHYYWSFHENISKLEEMYLHQHLNSIEAMEYVFVAHSVVGGALLIAMSFFSRAALKSSNTQAIVVMRNLPSAE